MRLLGAVIAASVFWLSGGPGHADDATEHDRQIERYLEVIRFPELVRSTFTSVLDKASKEDAELRGVIAMSDGEIIAAVMPTYRELLTLEEAKLIADFFGSETAATLTRLQLAREPDPLNKLTRTQQDAYFRFADSAGGAASARLDNLTKDQAFWDLVGMKLFSAARAPRAQQSAPEVTR
jgi:hypothetical protein